MKAATVVTLVATLLVAFPAGAQELPIAYFDQAAMAPARYDAMRAEVSRILTAAGVTVADDVVGEDGRATSSYVLRAVILDISPLRWKLPDHAMGVTLGRQMPPSNIYLFYPSIMRQLGNASLTDEEVGRALGRVVVHELVHAFAPDHKHSGRGITGHTQDRQSLTVVGTVLDDKAASALRDGLNTAERTVAQQEGN